MSEMPGYWRIDHRLHPRTGFMIFVPGLAILIVMLFVAFSDKPGKLSVLEGGAAAFAFGAVVISIGLWLDLGNSVAWDNDAVYIRQGGSRLLFRRHPFVRVPFAEMRGFVLHPSPRGVPPKYPLLEIDTARRANDPLFIDPNYFRAASLAIFINDVRERVPEMQSGPQAKVADRLLKLFSKASR